MVGNDMKEEALFQTLYKQFGSVKEGRTKMGMSMMYLGCVRHRQSRLKRKVSDWIFCT